ncbi:hypothetical protein [Aeoliella mucimassa]|uniref:Uncharacterized protein n=1 Tax=Aeoliella mucimassa TaxID=2527972 RepID=A0A518AJK3_9BACT|nr:hypothetical protein [Aeoliella mucimassa]QDU54918.1 hypothetical protein Pan181_11030 [Aeoliella mucimassa]
MSFLSRVQLRSGRYSLLGFACLAMLLAAGTVSRAQSIELPTPRAATNAALHYQRAVLYLGMVDPEQRALLEQPIWQTINPKSTDEDLAKLSELLIASRQAIRSALVGAEQLEADFGLDMRQYVLSSQLPHAEGMKQIGRLVALQGLQQQSAGEWKLAAETYLAGLRMGRQMTHQTTLAEAMAGVEILENMYFAISQWAVRCPDTALVDDVSHILDAMANDMVNPARTMGFEAGISKARLAAMESAYPDGPWAEMILEALGAEVPAAGSEELRQAAIAAAVKRGVPESTFATVDAFKSYMDNLRTTYAELARESAICLTLDPPHSIKCGAEVYAKYADKLPETERLSALNPARVASLFALHQAELDMLRQVLAASALKTDDGFPASADAIQARLGNKPLTSPFDGSEYEYEQLEDGRGMSLKIGKATVGGIELPEFKFRYVEAK